jgi:hypothetical protein
VGLTLAVALPEGVDNPSDRDYTNFQRCRNPLNILDAISVTRSIFNSEDPQILAPNYKIYLPGYSGLGICVPPL